MGGKHRGAVALVLAACAASLAGVRPLRSIEQLPAPILAPLEAALAQHIRQDGATVPSADRERACQVFDAWLAELGGPTPVAAAGKEGMFVPVLGRDTGGHSLTLRVPDGAVREGAPVTCRGALLGFATARGDEASVVLLGNRSNPRSVAGEWRVERSYRPVHFLLRGWDPQQRVQHRSSTVSPPPGQIAWTRDVSFLGDPLPPGLVLGRLVSAARDEPGGGISAGEDEDLRLQPILDPFAPGVVTIEVDPGGTLRCRTTGARLLVTAGGRDVWRLDSGTRDGIEAGDWVVQDGVYVGRVDVAGPHSATVRFAPPPGQLLVLDDGAGPLTVTPCTTQATSWPGGWRPRPGQLVVGGHLAVGGLVLGRIATVEADGFTLHAPPIRPQAGVMVLGW